MNRVHLGFEIGTGLPVELPLHHLVITGMTQQSGKTTTLEALITRSDRRAIAFMTKRGEGAFEEAHEIPPYFKPRIDWQYVKSLLEATMKEKMNFKEAWIIRACEGNPKSLEDVHRNVKRLEDDARAGMSKDMYRCLDAYFEIVLPEIRRTWFSPELKLADTLNVMHLESMSLEVQSLVIRSVLDEIYHSRNTIVVIPEAWKFCPRGRGSPVKGVLNELIRQGAVLGNYVWIDSQDIAAVDAGILKSVDIWILGRQRELNEIKRTIAYMPVHPKPRPEAIQKLGIGQFVACFGHEVKTVYVQPSWMPWDKAQSVATGMLPLETARSERAKISKKKLTKFGEEFAEFVDRESEGTETAFPSPSGTPSFLEKPEDADMDKVRELEALVADLQERLKKQDDLLRRKDEQLAAMRDPSRPLESERRVTPVRDKTQHSTSANGNIDLESIYADFRARLLKEKPDVLRVILKEPRIEVEYQPVTVQADGYSFKGRIARLIHQGWFDQAKNCQEISEKFGATGKPCIASNVSRDIKWFVESEFLEFRDKQYTAVRTAKNRVGGVER